MENVSPPTQMSDRSSASSSGSWTGLQSSLTRALVSCGGIGALLFTITYVTLDHTRPGYNPYQQPISSLSLGPGGWVQQVNFVVFGVLMLLSAVGWYRVLVPERRAIWFPVVQGISGLCLIGAGVFTVDPLPGYPPGAALPTSTVHGTLHTIFAWGVILSLALGCFALGVILVRLPQWRGWAVYTYLTGVLILVFWGVFVTNPTGPLAGLVERLSALSHALWLCAVTAALLVYARHNHA